MAKIFYVRERSGDYAQINFFKTEKEALNYGISEWPDFDMFGDEEDEDDSYDMDNDTWWVGDSIDFKKGILFSFEEGSVYVQAMDEDAAREYAKEEVGEYGAAIFFDGFKKGMYGYLGNGADGKGYKWDWDGIDLNESSKSHSFKRFLENITPSNMGGMGPVALPVDGADGSGDVPAGRGDAEEEFKKAKKEKMARDKKNAKNESFVKSFEAFSFDFEGVDIKNPFTDETARMDVDPTQYYGKSYAKSDIKKIVDASEEFISKYNEWKDMQPLDADEDLHADYGEHVKASLDKLTATVKKLG